MSNIVEFVKRDTAKWMQGPAICIGCGNRWQAVAPIGSVELECSECGTMKGIFEFPFAPADGDERWECGCGNQLFYITQNGHRCANCGKHQQY